MPSTSDHIFEKRCYFLQNCYQFGKFSLYMYFSFLAHFLRMSTATMNLGCDDVHVFMHLGLCNDTIMS